MSKWQVTSDLTPEGNHVIRMLDPDGRTAQFVMLGEDFLGRPWNVATRFSAKLEDALDAMEDRPPANATEPPPPPTEVISNGAAPEDAPAG